MKTYKQALQDIQNHTYTSERIAEYYNRLETVYNHTLSRGNYYLGKELGSYSDVRGSKATTEKEHIGRVLHYYPKTGVAEFQMESGQLIAGSPLLFIGSTTGALEVTPESIWVDDRESQTAQKGVVVTCKVPVRVRENDKVYVVKPRDSW